MFLILFSFSIQPNEHPEKLFQDLFKKYKETEFFYKEIEGFLDDGMNIIVYDIKKKLSSDVFCELDLLATLGQTQYFCYKKNNDLIWYIQRKTIFYECPYKLEGAIIKNNYFKYISGDIFAFNEENGQYDIQTDIDKYDAVVDARSLVYIINIIKQNIE
jgi:hypothetical protein